MKYFLTNTEPRNNRLKSASKQPKDVPPGIINQNYNDQDSSAHVRRPPRVRPRKRKCHSSESACPEIQRDTLQQTKDPSVSNIDLNLSRTDREDSVITIPCHNEFQLLADLSDVDDDDTYDTNNDEDELDEANPNRFCHGCKIVRVPNPWNHWCENCWNNC